MKKILSGLVALSVLGFVLVFVPVHAQGGQTMTDAHIEKIKKNCESVLTTLGRLHAHDAPQYINSNQTYFSISDKLMARLNSRLTLNRYDATDLVKISSNFNEALNEYRVIYKTYDDSMAELIKLDCEKAPVTFYDKVTEAREHRGEVHAAVVKLQTLIGEYRDAVGEFKTEHFSEGES